MTKQKHSDIIINIEKRKELEEVYDDKKTTLRRLNTQVQNLSREMIKINIAVNGSRATFQRKRLNIDRNELDRKILIQKDIELKLNQTKSNLQEVQDYLHQIKTELLSCFSSANVSNVIEHQNKIKALEKELLKFENLISIQRQIIEKNNNPIDETQELLIKRVELLAGIALGLDNKKQLNELDLEIEVKKSDYKENSIKNNLIIEDAEQTIQGLEPRKSDIKLQLERLINLNPEFLDKLCIGIAKQKALEYKKCSHDMGKALADLAAMDAFVLEIGIRENTGFFPDGHWHMKIPNLSFMLSDDEQRKSDLSYLNISSGSTVMNKELIKIKEDLKKQGIELV